MLFFRVAADTLSSQNCPISRPVGPVNSRMVLQLLIYLWISGCLSSHVLAQRYIYPDGRYLAARKGDPPPCDIQPGQTFCERVPDYPYEVILKAVKNSKFDISKFLVNDSTDDGPDFGNINPGLTGGQGGVDGQLPPAGESSNLGFTGNLRYHPAYDRDFHKRIRRFLKL